MVMVWLLLKAENCFCRFCGTSPSLIARNQNRGPTATWEDEVLKQASYLLVTKKRADKSPLRRGPDERKVVSPGSLPNSPRHSEKSENAGLAKGELTSPPRLAPPRCSPSPPAARSRSQHQLQAGLPT